MTGMDEGAYFWLTINYLLGRLDGNPANSVGIVDLGGGSVQQAYALTTPTGNPPEHYVKQVQGMGNEYNVYVHRWVGYVMYIIVWCKWCDVYYNVMYIIVWCILL